MKAVVAAVLVLIVAGCAPASRTEYHYFAPRTADGQACVTQCDAFRRECVTNPGAAIMPDAPRPAAHDEGERLSYDECSRRAQEEFEQCQMTGRGRGDTSGCYRRSCVVAPGETAPAGGAPTAAPDLATCDRVYRACFERCGGRIEARCEGHC